MKCRITFFQHRLLALLLCSVAPVVPACAQVDQPDPCSDMIAARAPN